MLFPPQTPCRAGGSRPTALALVPSPAPVLTLLPATWGQPCSSAPQVTCQMFLQVGVGLKEKKSTKAERATRLHCQAGSFSLTLCRDAFLPARVPAYCRDLGATCCRAACHFPLMPFPSSAHLSLLYLSPSQKGTFFPIISANANKPRRKTRTEPVPLATHASI